MKDECYEGKEILPHNAVDSNTLIINARTNQTNDCKDEKKEDCIASETAVEKHTVSKNSKFAARERKKDQYMERICHSFEKRNDLLERFIKQTEEKYEDEIKVIKQDLAEQREQTRRILEVLNKMCDDLK